MQIRDLRPLAAIVTVMVVIDALWNPTVLLISLATPDLFQRFVTPIASTVDAGALIFKFATMILFCRWIYVAGANLLAAGFDDLAFTPASRIWWFAVPVACLYRPFEGMRELWNASHGAHPYNTNNSLVATWWALWLLNGLVAWISNIALRQAAGSTAGLWANSALDIALAPIAILLIRRITQAQIGLDGSNLAEVFA